MPQRCVIDETASKLDVISSVRASPLTKHWDRVILCQINTGHNLTPSELNDFCEILVPMEISIPAKFYCFMATRFLRADIQNCQKTCVLATSCLRKNSMTSALVEIRSSFYANFKANKMPFPLTYWTNIFSRVVFSRSSNLTFDLVFYKMQYSNFLEKNLLCACNYYLKHLANIKLGLQWDCLITFECLQHCTDNFLLAFIQVTKY
jgi:hypothetical protein